MPGVKTPPPGRSYSIPGRSPGGLAKWFDRGHEHVPRGPTSSPAPGPCSPPSPATARWTTRARPDGAAMEFRTYSHINQHRGGETYPFVKPGEGDE